MGANGQAGTGLGQERGSCPSRKKEWMQMQVLSMFGPNRGEICSLDDFCFLYKVGGDWGQEGDKNQNLKTKNKQISEQCC